MLKFPPGSNTFTNKLAVSTPGACEVIVKLGVTWAVPSPLNAPSKMVLLWGSKLAVGLSKVNASKPANLVFAFIQLCVYPCF